MAALINLSDLIRMKNFQTVEVENNIPSGVDEREGDKKKDTMAIDMTEHRLINSCERYQREKQSNTV